MSKLRVLQALAASVAGTLCLTAAVPAGAQVYKATVFASGLNNARDLAFDDEGALYVAEGGYYVAGGPTTTTGEGPATLTNTGSITRVFGGVQERIVTGLPGLATETGSSTGPQGITFYKGTGYVVTGLGANPAVRDTDLGGTDLARGLASLWSFGPGGVVKLADLGNVEAGDPDGDGPDSNPFHIAGGVDGLFITDAGGNSIVKVPDTGAPSVVGVLPNITDVLPFPLDAVPTGIAFGPDGQLYVSQLTGGPFPPGASSVYSVDLATGLPTPIVTGLTTITDLVVDDDGTIYVLQLAAEGEFPFGPGSVKRVNSDGTLTTLYSGLQAPTGMVLGKDGAFYVTNASTSPGGSEILRLAPVPEPASWAMLILGFGIAGGMLRRSGVRSVLPAQPGTAAA